MADMLIIRSINEMNDDTWETLYWSNEWGWATIEEADKFTEEEASAVNLPVGGQWVYESAELGVDIPSSEGVEDG